VREKATVWEVPEPEHNVRQMKMSMARAGRTMSQALGGEALSRAQERGEKRGQEVKKCTSGVPR
jgi:hypothetical protein